MTRKSIMLAALTLLIAAPVNAKPGYIDAIINTSWAEFAGSQDRCPRFRVIKEAVIAERAAAGITEEQYSRDYSYMGKPSKWTAYAENPSTFCTNAWNYLGPNGTYNRQMLEAK
jgi:hypothetical protein